MNPSRLHYWIDRAESETSQQLVIRLVLAEKNAPASAFSRSALLRLAPTDKDILDTLLKEELEYRRKTTGRVPLPDLCFLQSVHISQAAATPLLKRLSQTHRLYFEDQQLIGDFFTKVELYYLISAQPSEKILVEVRLKWGAHDIPLSDCSFLGNGRPHWFIRGLSLKAIATDIGWKALKKAYETPAFVLEGVEKARFLEDQDPEDPDSPRLVFKEGGDSSSLKSTCEMLPVLVLKDRVGAFADLWMDYGNGHRIAMHDTAKPFPRLFDAERGWEKDLLESDFIKKPMGSSHYYCPVDKVAKSLTFLLELGWEIQDWKGRRVQRQQTAEMNVDERQRVLVVKGRVRYGEHDAAVADVVGAFNRRERFVQLGDGSVGLLPERFADPALQELVEEGEVVGDSVQVKKSCFGSISNLLSVSKAATSALQGWTERLRDFKSIVEVEPGTGFVGSLRPYQQQGLNWLNFLADYGFHGILADDMGLGKTVQVIALLSRLPQDHPHLIVMPTSLLFNWKNEIEKFLPGVTSFIHHGENRINDLAALQTQTVILTTYTTLRLDLLLFQRLKLHALILDEAQVIKNAHTQAAQAVCSLDAALRLSLTGTPIENNLSELWSHFHFLIPDLLGDEQAFAGELQAAAVDGRHLQRLKKRIAPFILRRLKEEVAKDLPERIDQVVWVEMGDAQRRLYDRFLAGVRTGLLKKVEVDGVEKHRMEILEAILRLRQICCHPLLVTAALEQPDESCNGAKWDLLFQDLETAFAEGAKVLVYSQFTSMLKLLAKEARERGWPTLYLDGATVDREKVVNQFQEDPQPTLFFISLKAGGVGLNLTAADTVFLYDPWWNQAVEEQAINRAHRIGRQKAVVAKRLVVRESVEEKMMKLKASKCALIDELFSQEHVPVGLTLEDLTFLLT